MKLHSVVTGGQHKAHIKVFAVSAFLLIYCLVYKNCQQRHDWSHMPLSYSSFSSPQPCHLHICTQDKLSIASFSACTVVLHQTLLCGETHSFSRIIQTMTLWKRRAFTRRRWRHRVHSDTCAQLEAPACSDFALLSIKKWLYELAKKTGNMAINANGTKRRS